MRGTRSLLPQEFSKCRFIPAYAGNTIPSSARVFKVSVHPRVCGEHDLIYDLNKATKGSSPRMRGTLGILHLGRRRMRFIPAYAGNTFRILPSSFCLPVHPRVCGEHIVQKSPEYRASGSSPRMRGTLLRMPRLSGASRFIPAYAGNTAETRSEGYRYAVHPRVCGEHPVSLTADPFYSGSSPRMRGTHCMHDEEPSGTRFIPAYAGNTGNTTEYCAASTVHPRVCGEHQD